MDFTKYVSFLESRALYFCRSDLLGDPFEGSYSRANITGRQRLQVHGEKVAAFIGNTVSRMTIGFRRVTYVNCWHMNELESAAMWGIYAPRHGAIALESSYSRLFAQLPDHAHVGVVSYRDYERDLIPEGNLFYPLLHKRKSFEHEQEVRAMFHEMKSQQS